MGWWSRLWRHNDKIEIVVKVDVYHHDQTNRSDSESKEKRLQTSARDEAFKPIVADAAHDERDDLRLSGLAAKLQSQRPLSDFGKDD